MAVYKPTRKGATSKFYICEFVYQGKRFQESTGAITKTVAKEYEKRRKADLERAAVGLPTDPKSAGIRSVDEVVAPYLDAYALNHRAKSILFAGGRLAQVSRHLGSVLLSDLTEDRIRGYVRTRRNAGASGRTINMELGELSRAMGQKWSVLWPKVRKMEERKDVGKALSRAEQHRLLDGLAAVASPTLRTLVPMLLLTGMRSGEALSLRWDQVDILNSAITVGRAKTSSGTGRVIPMNTELAEIVATHRRWFVQHFGDPMPNHHLFPWGSPEPTDPERHVSELKRAWTNLRTRSGVACRLHDLRHTFATGMAERGVSEATMLALMGHMSRAMLERYSHIRMTAKRDAVAGMSLRPELENSERVPVIVPVSQTSQHLQ